MPIFFTSDWHLEHANIIRYAKRPFGSVAEMNREIIERFNSRVAPTDTTYFLGDIGLKNPLGVARLLQRLNGTIHLIEGNHDKKILKVSAIRDRFASINALAEIKCSDLDAPGGIQNITLCHYAMVVWNKSHYGAWQLYGHSHGTLPETTARKFDVGVDSHDFYPWSYEEVKTKMLTKVFVPIDHHEPR